MATEADLYRLLVWSSPSYPIGAFSYSHGLEWAVEEGSVRNVATLVDFVSTVISRGGGWIDAVLFAQAYRCAQDAGKLDEICGSRARFVRAAKPRSKRASRALRFCSSPGAPGRMRCSMPLPSARAMRPSYRR